MKHHVNSQENGKNVFSGGRRGVVGDSRHEFVYQKVSSAIQGQQLKLPHCSSNQFDQLKFIN